MQNKWMQLGSWTACGLVLLATGCGTTRWTDTQRTATEQLLISDAMDRAVSELDFRALAGREVYLDASPLKHVTDRAYLVSVLRQQMLAAGCILRETREEADYVLEVRAGVVGTDRSDLMLGVPAVQLPSVSPLASVPSSIPELPLAKRTEQRAVAKIAVFAYNRVTGRPVWQSGSRLVLSNAKDIWLAGAGPFQRGTIYKGTNLAGGKLSLPLIHRKDAKSAEPEAVADEAFFAEVPQEDGAGKVLPATHTAPCRRDGNGAAGAPPRRLPVSGY